MSVKKNTDLTVKYNTEDVHVSMKNRILGLKGKLVKIQFDKIYVKNVTNQAKLCNGKFK